jgi:glycosyltransferase involved in cell wall biosynthesis
MRIVIDLQGAQSSSRHRGIGRYSLQFTRAFARRAKHHDVVILLNDALPDAIASIREMLHGIVAPEQIAVWSALPIVHAVDPENDARRRVSELIREAVLVSLAPDLVIVTSLFEGAADDAVTSIGRYADLPTAMILYDLIPLEAGVDYLSDPFISRWYCEKLEHLERSNLFFAISAATSEAARKFLQIPSDSIVDIGAGIEDGFADGAMAADMVALGISRPYFLYVSGIDRRKNHTRLIEAWSRLPAAIRSSHQLVLVGHMNPDHQDELRAAGRQAGLREGDLVVARNLSEPELKHLYASCLCLVFPSTQEGFGLPVLEAMAFGKPVIASDVAVIRSVHGLPDALFDPFNIDAITAAITRVMEDDRHRNNLIRHSMVRVKEFSWSTVAQRALDLIETTPIPSKPGQRQCPGDVRRTLIDRLAVFGPTAGRGCWSTFPNSSPATLAPEYSAWCGPF